jgi:dTDP-4-dehydrorhamnose reductase
MKLLVIGASGLVGSHLLAAAKQAGFATLGTARTVAADIRACQLGDQVTLAALLTEFRPEVVACAAGFTWADGCEADPERSRQENLEQPLALAQLCAKQGVRFVYYSSAYVFDGVNGNYTEADAPRPVNVYGRHKAECERLIAEATGGDALILRLIHVWGEEAKGKNFVYQVSRANRAGAELRVSSIHSGNPTWAGDVATWTLGLLQRQAQGIWHLAGDCPQLTRHAWAREILQGLQGLGQTERVRLVVQAAVDPAATPRPLASGLDTSKIQTFIPLVCRAAHDLPTSFR